MKLLLDEMLSPLIAEVLRSRSYDVQAIKEHPELCGLPDDQVLALARDQGRAIVTNNVVDFRPLHHEAIQVGGPGHFGMIFLSGSFRRTKSDVGRIADALEVLLQQYPAPDGLADREAWI